MYHALIGPESTRRWVNETPSQFCFVVKAYRELTGHGRPKGAPERPWKEIVERYAESVQPIVNAGKLTAILFQFPPWFDCTRDNVRYLRRCREAFPTLPLAIEFRHQSWFTPHYQRKTLHFLRDAQLIHVVCDEPQAGEGSVPIVPAVTHPLTALVRFHGRNRAGWNHTGRPDWRGVRYAYRYTAEELREWVSRIHQLKEETKQVTVLFNNNSRGDAAPNAQQLIDLLGLSFQGLAARQLGMFT